MERFKRPFVRSAQISRRRLKKSSRNVFPLQKRVRFADSPRSRNFSFRRVRNGSTGRALLRSKYIYEIITTIFFCKFITFMRSRRVFYDEDKGVERSVEGLNVEWTGWAQIQVEYKRTNVAALGGVENWSKWFGRKLLFSTPHLYLLLLNRN